MRQKQRKAVQALAALILIIALAIGAQLQQQSGSGGDEVTVDALFDARRSGVMLTVDGTIQRLLSDDNDGSRHQRFILETPSGRTVLVAHNIDLAPRIDALRRGDVVRLHGQYEWNERGGVVHWTHHDPQGRHEAGWIQHEGRRYE